MKEELEKELQEAVEEYCEIEIAMCGHELEIDKLQKKADELGEILAVLRAKVSL